MAGTIRRYLEQNTQPTLIVLCSSSPETAPISTLAPLYFPRSAREADAARWRLKDAGGAAGEPDHPERRIRIIHNPHDRSALGIQAGKYTYIGGCRTPVRRVLLVMVHRSVHSCKSAIQRREYEL